MKEEWKSWFITNRSINQENQKFNDRSYNFTNFQCKDVPFHDELKKYICSLNQITNNTLYTLYHVHTWDVGDYFSEHIDDNFRRKWAYVCELQSSECNTSLLVEGKEIKEGMFNSKTLHEVPKIKKGTRISLTVFGSTPDTIT